MEILTNYYVQYCTSKTVYELAIPRSVQLESGNRNRECPKSEVMEVEFVNHERLYIS
jgi:hypothetical protein